MKKLKLIIKKARKSIKNNNNRFLKGFLIIFAFSYFFFFLSGILLPHGYTNVASTKIGKEIEANDRKIQYYSSTYFKEKKIIEVVFEIENFSLDGIDNYTFRPLEKNLGSFKAKEIVSDNGFFVIHILDVKNRWKEISLKIDVDSKSENSIDYEEVSIYLSKKTIKKEKNIVTKSAKEYKIKTAQDIIKAHEDKIKSLNKNIKEEKNLIENGEESIKTFEDKKEFQTEEEIEKTNITISNIENEILTSESKIDDLEIEKGELKKRIKKQKEKLKAIK